MRILRRGCYRRAVRPPKTAGPRRYGGLVTSEMSGTDSFADFSRAPNIADNQATYEVENRAIDPSGVLWQALRDQADWCDRTIVDLGCGTGFWLPRYATDAARVIGVEPDP